MQADGGLVEDVAHPLQIGTQLGGKANTLRLAATQGGCRAVETQITQAHFIEEA